MVDEDTFDLIVMIEELGKIHQEPGSINIKNLLGNPIFEDSLPLIIGDDSIMTDVQKFSDLSKNGVVEAFEISVIGRVSTMGQDIRDLVSFVSTKGGLVDPNKMLKDWQASQVDLIEDALDESGMVEEPYLLYEVE